jgi:putative ABC transport system substrate-binding protein
MRRRDFIILLAGTMGGWPSALRAQQKGMPVIGFLSSTSPIPAAPVLAAFRHGLNETGYVEGQNATIEFRWAEGRYDRLPALAAELVDRKVDLIAATGGIVSARAAKNSTSSIPIIFVVGTDPIADGLVVSFARPGGNLTGISLLINALNAKRLELLTELVPQARVIALLVDPNSTTTEGVIQLVREAASARRVQLHLWKANSETEIDAAFETLTQSHMDALLVSANPFFDTHREQLLTLAARHALPAIYAWRDFAAEGGLISYGANLANVSRQLGIYAGKILKGAKPADLPVQQPTKFELVINLKTANALALTVPPSILTRADEVIE